MTNLWTAVVLLLSICCVIESFPKLEDITIIKEKQQNKHSCFVNNRDQIKAVVCSNCKVIETVRGYRVTTHHLELLQLHFLHDGKVTNVPLRINCNIEEQSPSTKVTQVMSRRKCIAMNLDNKAGIIVVYMDGKSSFSAIQIEPVEDFEINGLHEDTLYQICISVLNKSGESGNYSCVQTKTKQLTNKGSAVANQNGDQCKYAVTSIEADVTAHNLVKVKWKTKFQGYCQINNLEVRLLDKYSRKCLVLLVLYKRMKIFKTVKADNCGNRKDIQVNSLASGEVLQFWPHSSVHVQGVIVTSHGKINMNDGDYSSSNLIDTLANTEKKARIKNTTCYADCLDSDTSKPYEGIRSADAYGKPCIKWSESKWPRKAEGNRCYRPKGEEKAWCATAKSVWEYCKIPACDAYSKSHCIKSVNVTSSTSSSITGQFKPDYSFGKFVAYLILVHNDETKLCVDSIFPEGKKIYLTNYANLKTFIASCTKKTFLFEPTGFTFKNLDSATNYKVYIIPIDNQHDLMAAYYSERTKKMKPNRVTGISVNNVTSSSFNVSWKAPKNSIVDEYVIILIQNNDTKKTESTQNKSIAFYGLTGCTEYCVTVTARNTYGSSPISKIFCRRTLARGANSPLIIVVCVESLLLLFVSICAIMWVVINRKEIIIYFDLWRNRSLFRV